VLPNQRRNYQKWARTDHSDQGWHEDVVGVHQVAEESELGVEEAKVETRSHVHQVEEEQEDVEEAVYGDRRTCQAFVLSTKIYQQVYQGHPSLP
jgi:hypothetical protein